VQGSGYNDLEAMGRRMVAETQSAYLLSALLDTRRFVAELGVHQATRSLVQAIQTIMHMSVDGEEPAPLITQHVYAVALPLDAGSVMIETMITLLLLALDDGATLLHVALECDSRHFARLRIETDRPGAIGMPAVLHACLKAVVEHHGTIAYHEGLHHQRVTHEHWVVDIVMPQSIRSGDLVIQGKE
jgi:hypothetical protein